MRYQILYPGKRKKNLFQNVVCWKFYPECLALICIIKTELFEKVSEEIRCGSFGWKKKKSINWWSVIYVPLFPILLLYPVMLCQDCPATRQYSPIKVCARFIMFCWKQSNYTTILYMYMLIRLQIDTIIIWGSPNSIWPYDIYEQCTLRSACASAGSTLVFILQKYCLKTV